MVMGLLMRLMIFRMTLPQPSIQTATAPQMSGWPAKQRPTRPQV